MAVDKSPEISVILPVYNASVYLAEALQSILKQSFTDFELILINDGSTDNSESIILQFCNADERIRYISRENRGLIASLNEGISLSRGNFIARMDADDIAESTRFESQYNFLQRHIKVAALGTAYQLIDHSGRVIGSRKPPRYNWLIKPLFLFGSPFAHPSMMLNRRIIGDELWYDERYKHAEDYELWLRLSKKFKLANLAQPLLKYRVLSTSISRKFAHEQQQSVARALATHLCLEPNEKTITQAKILTTHSEQSMHALLSAFIHILRCKKHSVNPIIAFCYLIYFTLT
ncbi:glycosyltransferase [Rheinheimera baltica]|uniref:Glycosyltransferase n=1 Tax=Rheinheimera baltica TaxID=67576 RepID=A0ABT9HVD4_9GAMM|nr:glycosyltransferase [Rheinheimera baltica]MDP5134943.1 glycosyltransferase [Rheinheimera baltica]